MCLEATLQNNSTHEATTPSAQRGADTSTEDIGTFPTTANDCSDQYFARASRLLTEVPLIGTLPNHAHSPSQSHAHL